MADDKKQTPITAQVKDGNLLLILPMQEPKLSGSGKSHVLFGGTQFVKTTAQIDGKTVSVKAFVIVPVKDKAEPAPAAAAA